MSVGILLGNDGLFDVLWKFVSDSADSIPDILSANIHIAIQLKLNRDRADLFAGFASEDFDSRNIVDFLFHGLSHIGFDQFGIGARVDRRDGDYGGVDVGKFTNGKPGKTNHTNYREGQVEHDGRNGSSYAKFWEVHPLGVAGLRISFRPGANRRFPERAT